MSLKRLGERIGRVGLSERKLMEREKIEAKRKAEQEARKEKQMTKTEGQFILMNRIAFEGYIKGLDISRSIKRIQNHHTYIPGYKDFDGTNHFDKCRSMKRSHLKRGFSNIAQNLTTFNDGAIMICRPLKTIPAGIKGANTGGICIEHLGYFDKDKDVMTESHKKTIVWLNAILCEKFNLMPNDDSIVYHHWWNWSGKRNNGAGGNKSCPGTNFFGGNKVEDARTHFIPLIQTELNKML